MDREVLAKARANGPRPVSPAPAVRPIRLQHRLDRFWHWIEAAAPPDDGLELLLHHLTTFWDRLQASNVVLIHYCRSESRSRRRDAPPGGPPRYRDQHRFVGAPGRRGQVRPDARTGRRSRSPRSRSTDCGPTPAGSSTAARAGSGVAMLGPAELRRYEARVRQLAAADLAFWVHKGASKDRTVFLDRPGRPSAGR